MLSRLPSNTWSVTSPCPLTRSPRSPTPFSPGEITEYLLFCKFMILSPNIPSFFMPGESLKGTVSRDFCFLFFHELVSPPPQSQRQRWCTLSYEYLREFSKKFERPKLYTQGLGGNWFMKKNKSRKSLDPVPLNNKTFFYLLMSLTLIGYNHHNCTLWWSPRVQSFFTVDSGKIIGHFSQTTLSTATSELRNGSLKGSRIK